MKVGIRNRVLGVLTAWAMLSVPLSASAQLAPAAERAALHATGNDRVDAELFGARSAVYVLANPSGPNAVEAFVRNPQSGRLTYRGRFATGGRGIFTSGASSQHSLVNDERFLYVVNPGSNEISVFELRRDGSLKLASRTPSGGPNPVSLAVHDRLLYVVNQGDQTTVPGGPIGPRVANYTGFRVNRDGTLRPIAGSTVRLNPGDTPTDILFNKSGDLLVAARLYGRVIDSFAVNSNGTLSRVHQLQTLGPFGLSFHPVRRNQLFAAGFFMPGASSYNVSRRGALSVISDVIDPPGVDNCWTAFTPDGKFLWTSSFLPGLLSLFHVERDGSLRFVSTHQQRGPGLASDIATDAAGRFLYSLRPFPTEQTHIQVKRITNTPWINGGLRDVQDAQLPPLLGADGQDTRGPIGMLIVDNPGR